MTLVDLMSPGLALDNPLVMNFLARSLPRWADEFAENLESMPIVNCSVWGSFLEPSLEPAIAHAVLDRPASNSK
jgi:hypothetical protein